MSVPEQREPIHAVLRDGRQVALRPARPEDEAALAALYASLADRDVRLWFPGVGRRGAADLARQAAAPGPFGHSVTAWENNDLIGAAAYQELGSPHQAEVTVAVTGSWQSRGVGTLLLEHLVSHARLRGIESFHAEVPPGDAEMLRVLADLGLGGTPIAPATGLTGDAEAGPLARTRDRHDVVAIELPLRYDDRYLEAVAEREGHADLLSLRRVFAPRSVAVIGASRRDSSVGNAVVRHLLAAGFRGPVYPVNPHAGRDRRHAVRPDRRGGRYAATSRVIAAAPTTRLSCTSAGLRAWSKPRIDHVPSANAVRLRAPSTDAGGGLVQHQPREPAIGESAAVLSSPGCQLRSPLPQGGPIGPTRPAHGVLS